MIDSYEFGRIEINGRLYTGDVIIYPDGEVKAPWWRQAGHWLTGADLTALIETRPAVIVAGTGASGMMRPAANLAGLLASHGIELIAMPTDEAVTVYNDLAAQKKVAGCFHLTC